jgi:hypothetical protein
MLLNGRKGKHKGLEGSYRVGSGSSRGIECRQLDCQKGKQQRHRRKIRARKGRIKCLESSYRVGKKSSRFEKRSSRGLL